ncbi:CAP domain-containing protein [bacterium]|jgi:uncharacterized protein YkwD|nr:CAP domain-containing protein [bacterium]
MKNSRLVWGSLLALLVFGCGGQAEVQKAAGTPDPLAFLSPGERELIIETNKARVDNGVPELEVNQKCTEFAREQSEDMDTCHYFEHVRPACKTRETTGPVEAESFGERAKRRGFTRSMVSENLFFSTAGTAARAVEGWLNSPGHRKNMLDKNAVSIGVGIVGNYWTQCFTSEDGIPLKN